MLLAGLPACGSSSSGKCTTNCNDAAADMSGGKQDTGTTKQDTGVDQGKKMDAATKHDGAGDGARDMSVDVANPCAQSLAAACAATHDAGSFSVHCASTWAATTANAYLCSKPLTTVLVTTCGDYRELTDTNGSDEYVYIYDAAGDLVAVTHVQNQGGSTVTRCVGGSAGFVDPQGCSPPAAFSCAKDGGTHG